MDNELDIIQLRLIVRGALDCLSKDSIAINEALTAQGKAKLNTTMESLETALLWMRRMIEDYLNGEENEKV